MRALWLLFALTLLAMVLKEAMQGSPSRLTSNSATETNQYGFPVQHSLPEARRPSVDPVHVSPPATGSSHRSGPHCSKGKPCGNSCISVNKTCHK